MMSFLSNGDLEISLLPPTILSLLLRNLLRQRFPPRPTLIFIECDLTFVNPFGKLYFLSS